MPLLKCHLCCFYNSCFKSYPVSFAKIGGFIFAYLSNTSYPYHYILLSPFPWFLYCSAVYSLFIFSIFLYIWSVGDIYLISHGYQSVLSSLLVGYSCFSTSAQYENRYPHKKLPLSMTFWGWIYVGIMWWRSLSEFLGSHIYLWYYVEGLHAKVWWWVGLQCIACVFA